MHTNEKHAYETYTQKRILQLRGQKGYTARDMSLSIGQNPAYINKIENESAVPSLALLFHICDYLGVTPHDFFDEGNPHPSLIGDIVDNLKKLNETNLKALATLIQGLADKAK